MNTPQRPSAEVADINIRIARLQQLMRHAGMGAMLVSGNANCFYTTGLIFRGYVYIPQVGEPVWLVIRPDWKGPGIVNIRKPEQIPDALLGCGISLPATVGLEYAALSHGDYQRLSAALGDVQTPDASPLLAKARMVKTPYEQQLMRIDGVHHVAAYSRIPHLYREGMSDIELQIEIEKKLRAEGCLGVIRLAGTQMEINLGSVLAGDNADVPSPYDFLLGGAGQSPALPLGADGTILRPGMTVMVDMNGNFNGYQTDMTRVYSLDGDIPEKALKAHQVAIDILRRLERESLPGTPLSRMYTTAAEMAEAAGLSDYFQGHRQKAAFLGHGVGIELNEMPPISSRSKVTLEAGMVLAVEPKFVLPGIGAVGVENTYIVSDNGLENITPAPEEITTLQGV